MTIEVYGLSDKGGVRADNQDRVFFASDGGVALCVMADGMGGSDDGAFASSAVVSAAQRFWFDLSGGNRPGLDSIFRESHSEILEHQAASGKRCGTTATVLFIRDNRYNIIHAGDSRAYLLRGRYVTKLFQLTADDSYVARAVEHGDITPEEAMSHPKRHMLVNCLGMREAFSISRAEGAVKRGDAFMLCSDGLYNEVGGGEIKAALKNGKTSKARAESLLASALARGARDNVSIVTASAN